MLEGHTGSVSSVAFSPDGDTIISASLDHTIRAWEARATILEPQLLHESIGNASIN